MESLYPINNVAYHFVTKVDSDIIEKTIYSNKTFNNTKELYDDIFDKSIQECTTYSDVFITCCTLNSDYRETIYLWRIDCANNKKIYKFTLWDILMTLYSTIVCNENKIPNTTPEESKHDVIDDIKIVPKSSSTEEKKPDEIEQTNQSSEFTDKDEEKEQTNQSSETTKKREPIPIYYNDKIVRYLLPGEDAPDNTEPVFDKDDNVSRFIISDDSIKRCFKTNEDKIYETRIICRPIIHSIV